MKKIFDTPREMVEHYRDMDMPYKQRIAIYRAEWATMTDDEFWEACLRLEGISHPLS